MLPSENLNRKGFTLVEIILALMIASIMAGFLTVFFDVSFQNGGAAVSDLQKSLRLHSVMEKMTTDYNNNFQWKTANRYRAGAMVKTTSGGIFEASADCISGGLEPASAGNDGGCEWAALVPVPSTGLEILKSNITKGAYAWYDGTDYVVYGAESAYVEFSGTAPNYTETIDPTSDILKVILSNENGERLTAYFPEP